MKKVMLYAYTANNLGDDLFIQTICTRYPDTPFHMYAPKIYHETFAALSNLTIIPSDSIITKCIRKILKPFKGEYLPREMHAKKATIGIYLGGSIFAEHDQWQTDIRNLESMLRTHDKLFILGANFGPSKSAQFVKTYARLFAKAHDICFRDQASLEQFAYLPNVRQAADVVFQLPIEPNHKTTNNNIVISVIKPALRKKLAAYETDYINKLVETAEHFINKGATITLMSFCEAEQDLEICQEIHQKINAEARESVTIFHYYTNITEALSTIQQAKAIIATRFHAMILGWLFTKPVYPIIYSNKMKTVIQDNLFPGKYVEIKDIAEINPQTVYNTLNEGTFEITAIKKDAEIQFAVLDRHLVDRPLQ